MEKYGRDAFKREIVQQFDTREEAFQYERELLTEDVLTNEFCLNLIQGGAGYAHEYSETFKDRISHTRKSRIQQGIITPAKHSVEHRTNLTHHNPGGIATSKRIYQIDGITGYVIKEWESSRRAGMTLNIKSWRNVSNCASLNKHKTVSGFFWRWVGDSDVVDGWLSTINSLNNTRLDPSTRSGKRIVQTTYDGHIREWKNMCEAARELKIDNSSISLAVKTGKVYFNSTWKLA